MSPDGPAKVKRNRFALCAPLLCFAICLGAFATPAATDTGLAYKKADAAPLSLMGSDAGPDDSGNLFLTVSGWESPSLTCSPLPCVREQVVPRPEMAYPQCARGPPSVTSDISSFPIYT